MLFNYLLITICCVHLKPIKAFIYSFEDAINIFMNSDSVFANLDLQKTFNHNDLLCDEQLRLFVSALKNREEWAILMFDAWGKLPSGLAYGNNVAFGNYDQCMSIEHAFESTTNDKTLLTGQSCLLPLIENSKAHLYNDIDIFSSMKNLLKFHDRYSQKRTGAHNYDIPPFMTVACVPAVCSPRKIQLFANEFVKQFNFSVPVFDVDRFCQTNVRPSLSVLDWLAVLLFSFFGFLLISSTVYDVLMKELKKSPSNVLKSFSVYSNVRRLFTCKESKSPDVLECVNGIRVLSIVWIVYLHSNFISIGQPAINSVYRVEWAQNMFTMFYHSGDIAVDTFLVVGGLLVAWQFFKDRDQNKKLNLLKLYLHRYFRLTTVTAAAILFIVTLLKYVGNGPLWMTTVSTTIELCEKNWWSALLHFQNYVNPNDMCLGQTWYLSLDMQLFIVSPFLLYPIWKWGKQYTIIIVVLIFASVSCTFATVFMHEFRLSFFEVDEQTSLDHLRYVYLPTHTRMGPYLIGLLLGCVLHTYKGRTIRIRRLYVLAAWLLAVTTILSVIFGTHSTHRSELNETVFQSAMYQSMSRVAWSVAIAWMIFACQHHYGGPVNWLLSLSLWQPIAKLSYCIYVLHLPIQIMLSASEKQAIYLSDVRMAHKFWGDFGFAFMLSLLWTLTFEMPIPILENYLLSRDKNKTSVTASVDDVNANGIDNCVVVVLEKDE